jgi:hypothetical protein
MSTTAAGIQRFLERAPLGESRIVFDGCGPNGAVQYEAMSLLGLERIFAAEEVHVLSSSAFAYLFFLARHRGELALTRRQLKNWDTLSRQSHGVIPGVTLVRSVARLVRGQSAALSSEGLAESFRRTVRPAFATLTVADLPPNVRFWLYNASRRELQAASAQSQELRSMRLTTLVQAAANVPRVFGRMEWNGEQLVDPIYSPRRRELYSQLRAGRNVLVSNIFKTGETPTTIYVRPTRGLSGQAMLLKDFGLFLSGMPNPALGSAVDRGLFETAAL